MGIEELKRMLEKRLMKKSEEYRDGKKLMSEAQFNRFWDGKIIAIKDEITFLETVLEAIRRESDANGNAVSSGKDSSADKV